MSALVHLTCDQDVAIVRIDNPPVNALSPTLIEALERALAQALADVAVRALVITGGPRTFVAGADVRALEQLASDPTRTHTPRLAPLLSRIEAAPKPVVMALAGPVFGGGLELAMAGHYRLAQPDARLAQPEVKLGLIPGAGGTQRLPRLVGLADALVLCAEGEPIEASRAHALGLVDVLVEGNLLTQAVAFARAAAARPWRCTRDRHDKLESPEQASTLATSARHRALRRQRGQQAPLLAIEAVEAAARLPFEAACQHEHELFARCLFGEQARALMHVFFAEQAARRIPDVPRDTPALALETAGVLGAGTMGRGIAMALANAGLTVLLADVQPDALASGLATIRDEYARAVAQGRQTRPRADECLARIRTVAGTDALGSVDLVIEAVVEDLEVKRTVFAALDRQCHPGTILATNTSTLDVDALAAATTRPDAVLGLHFFNPAPVMRLLEIVRGRATSPQVLATALRLAKRLGKLGVVVGNGPGFVANRMLRAYRREAQFLVEEGARPEVVDQALVDFGLALGPLAIGDLVGLDVAWHAQQALGAAQPAGLRRPFAEACLYEWGRYGRKTGAGWYLYDEARVARPDAALVERLHAEAHARGLSPRVFSADESVKRCIYALVNEGARLLAQGLVRRASDIDIICVTGLGFPGYRGGPMWYADTVGLDIVVAQLVAWRRDQGAHWEPAPLLSALAQAGRTFADLDREQA